MPQQAPPEPPAAGPDAPAGGGPELRRDRARPRLDFQRRPAADRFEHLTTEEKNIIKTLWNYQKGYGGKTPARWGFKVGTAAPDHLPFAVGVALLRAKQYVWIGEKELVYLTDEGIDFAQSNDAEIQRYPLPFRKFDPA